MSQTCNYILFSNLEAAAFFHFYGAPGNYAVLKTPIKGLIENLQMFIPRGAVNVRGPKAILASSRSPIKASKK